MLAKRIIPCLDIKDGRTVKGINFLGLDELTFLDITATIEGRDTFAELVKKIALHLNIPFTVGGGIKSVHDVGVLLAAGADKITINSAAVYNPQLVTDLRNSGRSA